MDFLSKTISSGAAKVSLEEMFNAISSSVLMYVLRYQCYSVKHNIIVNVYIHTYVMYVQYVCVNRYVLYLHACMHAYSM